MSSQARPSFFCSRPNGVLTPLIALDDLPAQVTIRGVARILTAGETQGMTSCGVVAPRSEPWTLDGTAPTSHGGIINKGDLAELQAVLLKIMADDNVATHLRMSIKGILYRGLDAAYILDTPASNAAAGQSTSPVLYDNAAGNAGNTDNTGNYGNYGNGKQSLNHKKEYCSYWIRHGECDYQQQGCLYKHEMPTDPFMLEKLGLRDIPRWYREKYNVPSLLQPSFSNPRGPNHHAIVDQPTPKAIQYHATTDNASTTGTSGTNNSTTNSTTNSHPHRGGRYKSPRGAGFGAGKGRGNGIPNWNKNGNRSGLTQTSANYNNATPETSSPSTSENSFKITTGTKLDLLSDHGVSRLSEPDVMAQHILDKDGITRNSLSSRLSQLTTTPGGFNSPMNKEAEKDPFRTKSRRLFDFGSDGGVKLPRGDTKPPAFNQFANRTETETADKAASSAATQGGSSNFSASLLRELVATSEPIHPSEVLLNWGAIGEPVQRPTSTMTDTNLKFPFDSQYQDYLRPVSRADCAQYRIDPKKPLSRLVIRRY
ncbi:uncharacterized protein N7482_003691 [Penicillium canariense]|uniref:C3H1-type domain-containing protein n=1 Tax=Penicillium canariense TaxID=189055 RepID=A0A9W9I912_9EURO|nr:uncharacterized protein N7482_003691 [Penicillium canariense]KAJ5168097.1 hypothetical protein N7482_003691 [Penicillium canariense]